MELNLEKIILFDNDELQLFKIQKILTMPKIVGRECMYTKVDINWIPFMIDETDSVSQED